MEDFHHVDIKYFVQEIQSIKQDLNRIEFNRVNELREIDQNTLKTKFQNLSQLFSDIRANESNIHHLLQVLRVNIQEAQKSQIENDEQTSKLVLLEKEHGDLLLQLKDTQLSLENFRTTILDITKNINQTKVQIQTQQETNDHLSEQTSTKINQLISNAKDIRLLLLDYKSLVQQIDHLLKLIFHTQTEIEIHHKSILIYQTKFEKYKQDLTFSILHRTTCEDQVSDLRKIIDRQNQNLEQLNHQQTQILQHRRQLHQQIDRLEQDKTRIINHQQQLLETIKQANQKNQFLEKQISQSNQISKNLNFTYRKLIHDQNKQQDLTDQLHRTIQTNNHRLQLTKTEIDQFSEHINHQNRSIDLKEIQIESQMKELDNLQSSFSATREELLHQRTKVNENKTKVQTLTQKMHRLIADEKPLIKEISHYQRQVNQNEISYKHVEMGFKQNETKVEHYKTMINKLIRDSKQDQRILGEENSLLKRCENRIEKTKDSLKILNKKNKYSEESYHDLKGLSRQIENENQQLKQQYAELTFIVQLLGQRHAILNNQLKPLYEKTKYLSKHHVDKVKSIDQSKSDLSILHKYYLHLQSYHHQLQHYEYLHPQPIRNRLQLPDSNSIHHWQTLMISSPEKFNKISKFLLIKKKLVQKSNELSQLKQIFHEKKTLHHHLSRIFRRRLFILSIQHRL